jgi:hypothetical protein
MSGTGAGADARGGDGGGAAARFTQAGYYVYSVKARSCWGRSAKKKVKLETFLIFNQQFLTLIGRGCRFWGRWSCWRSGRRFAAFGRSWRMWRRG